MLNTVHWCHQWKIKIHCYRVSITLTWTYPYGCMINVYLEIGHICRQDRIIKNVNISIVLLVFDICCPKTAKDYAYDLSYNMHY